jgi:GNAT superfamily N-acetyltransferase
MDLTAASIRPAFPADAAGIARVHVSTWRTAYKGILKGEILAGLSVEEREQNWLKRIEILPPNCFIFVAELNGKVIGFSTGGPERTDDTHYKGEIYGLYLLQEHQRQGIGRRLVEASVVTLLSNGMNSMLIWVLHENPSCKFYEAIGGKYICEKEVDIRGQNLMEVAYGWDNLQTLIKKDA